MSLLGGVLLGYTHGVGDDPAEHCTVSLFAIWLVFWIATCHPAGRVAGLRRPLIGTPESPIGGNDQFQPRGCLIRLARITTIGHPRLGVMSRDVVLAPARNDTVPIQEVSVQTACH